MLGQMIVARFSGVTPPASLLSRVRAGQVGGVILFGDNLTGGLDAAKTLTQTLQKAASAGGNPPLLIMTDQEGGEVKRLPGPPALAPAEMTSTGVAFAQGRATGGLLRQVGINVDLAPVADVARVRGSFLGTRSFGSDPGIVARRACAFAAGLASQHVAYTLKHFPGLGFASASTDISPVSVSKPASSLRADYQPYENCGRRPLALVMVSSAIYPNLAGPQPAVMTPAIYERELPLATGASSTLTISDDLETPAIANEVAPARQAINAGLDVLLYAETEQASGQAYARLLAEARSGLINAARIRAADEAIASLKQRVQR
jgi:beta-N-acetylhexosaminidase